MSEEVIDTIKQQISENPIILYIGFTPAPQCGFLRKLCSRFVATFCPCDILSNPEIRAAMPGAEWPTFPSSGLKANLSAVVTSSRRCSSPVSLRRCSRILQLSTKRPSSP